jgi:hypothetical protein
MKKQITSKLSLSKETLRHLSERDLRGVVGGISATHCVPTGISDCADCPTQASCISNGSCPTGRRCCA